jgi:hypothetical protein
MCLRVNLLGPGPRLMGEKKLPERGLTKFEKHWSRVNLFFVFVVKCCITFHLFYLKYESIKNFHKRDC